jgi:hypothetical protein
MESMDKNKKILMGLSAVGVAGACLYFLAKIWGGAKQQEKNEKKSKNQHEGEVLLTNFVKDANYLASIEKLKATMRNQTRDNLSKNFLIAVNQVIMQLAKSEFLSAFVMIRNARRSLINDLVKYSEFVAGSMSETDQIIDQALNEVFSDLGIDPEFIEVETGRVAEEDPQFSMFMLYMIESIKSAIPSKRAEPVTLQNVIEFYEFQIQTLEKTDFTSLAGIDPELRMHIKQTFVLDRAAIDLTIEEEDLIRNPRLMMANQQLMNLQNKLQSILMRP